MRGQVIDLERLLEVRGLLDRVVVETDADRHVAAAVFLHLDTDVSAHATGHQQHERDDAHSAAQVVFTMSKLQGRWWLTLLGTEPSRRKRVTPVMPRLPITTRS